MERVKNPINFYIEKSPEWIDDEDHIVIAQQSKENPNNEPWLMLNVCIGAPTPGEDEEADELQVANFTIRACNNIIPLTDIAAKASDLLLDLIRSGNLSREQVVQAGEIRDYVRDTFDGMKSNE